MKITAILALAAIVPSCAPFPYVATRSAQVSGCVRDAVTGKPVAGAVIQPDGTSYPSAKSGADGHFVLHKSNIAGFYMTGPCPKGPSYRSYDHFLVQAKGYASSLIRQDDMKVVNSDPKDRDAGDVLLQRGSEMAHASGRAVRKAELRNYGGIPIVLPPGADYGSRW